VRNRHQEGSLQVRQHGRKKMWVLLYREGSGRRYLTLGQHSKLSKSDAQKKRDEIMNEVNARQSASPDPDITFGAFFEGVALPFLAAKWKTSTKLTTENRIRCHLLSEFKDVALKGLGLKMLQAFLKSKAATLSKSVVAHLRWDLRGIFKLAIAEGYIERDPTAALYTPKEASTAEARVMTGKEVEQLISTLDERERVIAHLAVFGGIRPGEILALQRKHVSKDCGEVVIEQRLYRGDIDTPKTNSSVRTVAIPSHTAYQLREWMTVVGHKPTAWVFASEKPEKPMWRDNVWFRNMKPCLTKVGLGWANFQVMRRTNASLGHEAGIDPKVSADQRGHGIGVSIDVYTHSSIETRRVAAERLEHSVLSSKADAAKRNKKASNAA
jgi:integrase